MKKIIIIAALLSSPAYAQQAQPAPTVEDVQVQYLTETGQLRVALAQALTQIKGLKEQLAKTANTTSGAGKQD